MNVPTFPTPPPAINDVPSSTFKCIKKTNVRLPNDYPTGKFNRNTFNKSLTNERRVYRSTRFARLCNSVHPRQIVTKQLLRVNPPRVIEFTIKMTERHIKDEDDDDVVCATGASAPALSPSPSVSSKVVDPEEISEKICGHLSNKDESNQIPNIPEKTVTYKNTGVQTHDYERLYMLRVLPTWKDIAEEDTHGNAKTTSRICKHFRLIGRLCLCQLGLAWLLTCWTVAGAGAFYATESPRERAQVFELKIMQKDLAIGLAMELRQLKAAEEEMEPLWSNKVKDYVLKHEKLLLAAVNAGYGEGGDTSNGQLWTFPGCLLFTISLITTLGFGAPVPRTTSGRTIAVIFAAFGIPAHFLLIFNLGLLLATRLQKFAIRRKYGENCSAEVFRHEPMPKWVKLVPFLWIAIYYSIGIIGFGVGRSRPLAASILFPLDFTVAGGLAATAGIVRILYGLYLEVAVTIAAIAVAVIRVSATESLTNIGLKYGLLTEM